MAAGRAAGQEGQAERAAGGRKVMPGVAPTGAGCLGTAGLAVVASWATVIEGQEALTVVNAAEVTERR